MMTDSVMWPHTLLWHRFVLCIHFLESNLMRTLHPLTHCSHSALNGLARRRSMNPDLRSSETQSQSDRTWPTKQNFLVLILTDHYSSAVEQSVVCVCVCVWTTTFVLHDLCCRTDRFVVALSKVNTEVKVLGQTSRLQEENVAKVVGTTSS